jgi:hypothetical protein
MKEVTEVKVGQKVVTVHGEQLEVMETKTVPEVTKKGVVTRPETQMFLAKSGENLCWFPVSRVKEVL